MAERVRQSHVVATDDTILPMLSPGKTKGADVGLCRRPGSSLNVFDFTLDRGATGETISEGLHARSCCRRLRRYDGVVAATPSPVRDAGVTRTKVVDAEKNGTGNSRVRSWLLRPLFAIENRPGKLLPPSAGDSSETIGAVLAELRQKLLVWKEQLIRSIPWPMR